MARNRPRVGLVLGAGGVVGGAYHAGVLTALEYDLGFDARDADIVAGTSAGALAGALLRRGIPSSDLAAWTVDASLSPAGALIAGAARPEFDPLRVTQFLRLPRLPHLSGVAASVRRPLRFDPLRVLMTHLHDGSQRLQPHLEFLGAAWPDRPLYECAVRRRDGHRVVFGRADAPRATLPAAIAASCAVPGYFAPARIGTEQYLDGGVASATNADVVRDHALDVLIVVAPMSARSNLPLRPDLPIRMRVRRRLDAELRRFAPGTAIVRFEPSARVLRDVGFDFMSEEHQREIVAQSFLDGGRVIAAHAEALAPLRRRRIAAVS